MPLPTAAVVSYNGVTFNSLVRSNISGEPQYDDAGRTVIYVTYTLEVDGYITPGAYGGGAGVTSTDMVNIRAALQRPGGALVITGTGFGDLSVNFNTAPHDVEWGPKPRLLSWNPIGSASACLVKWRCEFRVPECASASYFGILSWNYSFAIDIDNRGLTTRTIRGHVALPNAKRAVNDPYLRNYQNIDALKERLRPSLPQGFKRKQSFVEAPDRSKLEFTFTDEEIPGPNAYPPGISDINAKVTVRVTAQGDAGAFTRYMWVFTGQATAEAGQPPNTVGDRLLFIMTYRLGVMKNRLATKDMKYSPVMFEVGESLFDADGSLSVAFVIFSTQAALLQDILYLTGIYEPLPLTWDVWHASMELGNGAFTVRGNRGLIHDNSADAIIDLCLGVNPGLPDPAGGSGYPFIGAGEANLLDPGDLTGVYLWWENHVDITTTSGTVFHLPLAEGVEQVEEKTHSALQGAVMHGYALRVGVKTEIPNLILVNGNQVTEIGKAESGSRIVQTFNGQPVYWTWWRRRYACRVAQFTRGRPVAPNQFLTNSQTTVNQDPLFDVIADDP